MVALLDHVDMASAVKTSAVLVLLALDRAGAARVEVMDLVIVRTVLLRLHPSQISEENIKNIFISYFF